MVRILGFFLVLLTAWPVWAESNPWLVDLHDLEFDLAHSNDSGAKIRRLQQASVQALHAVALLEKAATNPDTRVRRNATHLLYRLGPLSAEAESTLIDQIQDQDAATRAYAMAALIRINGTGVDAVIVALSSDKAEIRLAAEHALREKVELRLHASQWPKWLNALRQARGDGLVAKLNALLKHPNSEVAGAAVLWLGQIGMRAKPALYNLIGMLRQDNPTLSTRAAMAIGQIGPHAHVAKEDLVHALNHSSGPLRVAAAVALDAIGYPEPARLALQVEMNAAGKIRCLRALQAVKHLRDPGPELRKEIVQRISETPDSDIAFAAAGLIEQYMWHDADVVAVLKAAAHNKRLSPYARSAALSALSVTGDELDYVVQTLKQLPLSHSPAEQLANFRIYARMSGEDVKPLVTSVLPFLQQPQPQVHNAALNVFAEIVPQAQYAMPYIVKRMMELPIKTEEDRQFYYRMADLIRRVQTAENKKESA